MFKHLQFCVIIAWCLGLGGQSILTTKLAEVKDKAARIDCTHGCLYKC